MKGDSEYMSSYNEIKDIYQDSQLRMMGIHAAGTWHVDPKRLGFVLSRYKFVAKMLAGKSKVLEIGAGDAWASRIVKQGVGELTCLDVDEEFITNSNQIFDSKWPVITEHHDMTRPYKSKRFDAIYGIDVLEHIDPKMEESFLNNVCQALEPFGVAIFGMPSIESQIFSRNDNGHVNCKTGEAFRTIMLSKFENVFMFSMNDEVIHTGFFPMSQYLFAIGVSPRNR